MCRVPNDAAMIFNFYIFDRKVSFVASLAVRAELSRAEEAAIHCHPCARSIIRSAPHADAHGPTLHPPGACQDTCMYYQEWNRPFNSFADMENSADEDQKLIFGMLFSLKEVSHFGRARRRGPISLRNLFGGTGV